MRRGILLLLIAATLPAFASRQVSVEQTNDILSAAGGKSDAETARRLSDIELTGRPSNPTLARWRAGLPGPKSVRALALLTDTATFLNLPASELPLTPAPDRDAQRKIMALTVSYVGQTIHQLPNFFATRSTSYFEDTPQGYGNGGMVFVPGQPLHPAGQSTVTVLYRNGAEVSDAAPAKASKSIAASHGLTTAGEFGPILVLVLVDAARSTLVWSHWEPGISGPIAVFRYAVPQGKSHYQVSYCCVADPGSDAFETTSFQATVGYHGEMSVDPSTGSVLRMTAEADLKTTDPIVRADIMVEYGAVEIGGKPYICPARSVSISLGRAAQAPRSESVRSVANEHSVQYAPGHLQTLLNEVSFTDYHLFHADSRLVADAAPPVGTPSGDGAPNPAPAIDSNADAGSTAAAAPPVAEDNKPPPTSDVAATPAMASPEAAPKPGPEVPAATSPAAAEPGFNVPSLNTASSGQVTTFKAKTEAVVVDVVVTKGKDEPVTGLNKQDFVIMENGTPQPVDLFEEHGRESRAVTPLPKMPPNVFTNQPAATPGDSVNVLLLDSLNTPREDQIYVHQQIMNFLKTMQPGSRIAIFGLGSRLRFIQGFTDDPDVLRVALNDKKTGVKPDTTPASRSPQDDEDDKEHVAILSAMAGGTSRNFATNANIQAVAEMQADFSSFDTDKRVAMTLEALRYIARYLAGVPGRKNLIWFSTSFPVSVFPKAMDHDPMSGERDYTKSIRETADLFTLAKVAIYPVGAEGVMINHTADMDATISTPTSPVAPMGDFSAANAEHAARVAAMGQLASDTGGEAIYNTNDLNKALSRAIDNGSHYYTVVYTPTNRKMDGKYRRIDVKLSAGKYKLAYRRGYYADEQTMAATAATDAEPGTDADPLRPMLARGMPSATQLLYGVRVLPTVKQPAANDARAGGNDKLAGPVTRYSVDFMIRWTDVDLQPTPKGTQRGTVQLDLVAYGRDGKPVNWVSVTQRMNLDDPTFAAIRRSGIPAHLEIDLPQQNIDLQTGVYDWSSKRAGTLEVPIKFSLPQSASASPESTQNKPN